MSESNTQREHGADHNAKLRRLWLGLAFVVGAVTAIGAAWGHVSGYGVFGHRLLLYGENDLYILNLGDEKRYVSIEGRERQKVGAEGARLLSVVGGESTIAIYDGDQNRLDLREVHTDRSHLFLSLSEASCLAVSEIAELSDDEGVSVEVVDWLTPTDSLYAFETRQVVWPRVNPAMAVNDDARGALMSIEPADCSLEDDEEFLSDYLESRLEERLEPPAVPDSKS